MARLSFKSEVNFFFKFQMPVTGIRTTKHDVTAVVCEDLWLKNSLYRVTEL